MVLSDVEDEEPKPCPRISEIVDRLFIAGFGGGFSVEAIECVLHDHSATHLVICGHQGIDGHVAVAETAADSCGVEVHVAALVPKDLEQLPGILDSARQFVADALVDELNCVIVACSKGASRSVAVTAAHLAQSAESGEEGKAEVVSRAVRSIAARRWRIWPSSLLVDALLALDDRRAQGAGRPVLDMAGRAAVRRNVGVHAAWATAWHNGVRASRAKARAAWDEAVSQGGGAEAVFARCKASLLGVNIAELDRYEDRPTKPTCAPHVEMSVVSGLLLCGLGGLAEGQVVELLSSKKVSRVVVCGVPGRDKHVTTLQKGAAVVEIADSHVHVVPIADSDTADLAAQLWPAIEFLRSAVKECPAESVLVACRQGASRSASVIIAYTMAAQRISALAAFRDVATARWRVWPNAGFVKKLFDFENELLRAGNSPPVSEDDRLVLLRAVGVHAAWAANRQNLEETGFGRQGLTIEDVDKLWDEATGTSGEISEEELFEKCKALALGVDLREFQDPRNWHRRDEPACPPAKRTRIASEEVSGAQ